MEDTCNKEEKDVCIFSSRSTLLIFEALNSQRQIQKKNQSPKQSDPKPHLFRILRAEAADGLFEENKKG